MQEVESYRVAVRPERRRQAERELRGAFQQALETMEAMLAHAGDSVLDTMLRALTQWLHLTGASEVDIQALRSSALLQRTYAALAGQEHFEAAVDAVDELVWCCVYHVEHQPHVKSDMQGLSSVRFELPNDRRRPLPSVLSFGCAASRRRRHRLPSLRGILDSRGSRAHAPPSCR